MDDSVDVALNVHDLFPLILVWNISHNNVCSEHYVKTMAKTYISMENVVKILPHTQKS
jgi:hypothetical protein